MNLTSLLLVIAVNFGQAMYTINENAGVVQVSLILSNPSSTAVMIKVFNVDGSATGKYISILSFTYILIVPIYNRKVDYLQENVAFIVLITSVMSAHNSSMSCMNISTIYIYTLLYCQYNI